MSWLTAHELEHLIRQHGSEQCRSIFIGIFPRNRLPTPEMVAMERRRAYGHLLRASPRNTKLKPPTGSAAKTLPPCHRLFYGSRRAPFARPIHRGYSDERWNSLLPLLLLINTDVHNLPGRHWISIFIDDNAHGEVFDSLATPLGDHVVRFMNTYAHQWTVNRVAYQHPLSTLCGVYVLCHILERLNAVSLDDFCRRHFTSDNCVENERRMRRYFHRLTS